MQINVIYDASVARAPSGFVAALTAAVQYFEQLIVNPITVNIAVGWGEVQGMALAGNACAENIEAWPSGYSYSQVAAALEAAGAPGAVFLPLADPTNGRQFTMTSAEAKVLGFIDPRAPATDAWVGFSDSIGYNFDTSPNHPALQGVYDFYGIAIHELSQVLGRQITDGADDLYAPMDLDHFSAPGVRDLNSHGGYFSTDDGVTNLNDFNSDPNWGDPGDWLNTVPDVFDMIAYPGIPMPVTARDLTAMQSLGWTVSLPNRPTVALPSSSLSGTQFFDGSAGGQSIFGGGFGDETVWGGAGDAIAGGAANMTIGGAQYETIVGGTGYQFLDGSAGYDSVVGGAAGAEMIWSGYGDTINGGGAANETIGGAPGDTVIGGNGAEFIDASSGNQLVVGGGSGAETIWGGPGDTVYGGGCDVTIGGGLHDTIAGGTGNELLSGWLGQQVIIGGRGNETIVGGVGDVITGGTGGNEFINGAVGSQLITGGSGGNETIWSGAGDTINGGGAANETIGGVAGDTIAGGAGTEFIDGSSGEQLITVGSGNETVWGGPGDTINGGSGRAVIGLGAGPEFIGAGTVGGGADTVFGFNLAGGDRIILPNAATAMIDAVLASATISPGGMLITFGNGLTLMLAGITHIDNGFFS